MKKIVIAAMLVTGLVTAGTVMASDNMHTVSVGYIHGKVNKIEPINLNLKLKGINLQYRYEWDSPVSLVTSFSYMSGKNSESKKADNDVINTKADVKYYSLTAGPAYRFNEYVSVYGDIGLSWTQSTASYQWLNHETNGLVQRGFQQVDNKIATFVYSVGVMVNPVKNVSVNVGYERGSVKFVKTHAINSFTLGIGYRF